jgi:hypothetical protein
MTNDEIEYRILRYLDDGFENSDYMAEIVTALPLPDICAVICNLLRSDCNKTFDMTALFLRDTVIMGRHNLNCVPFCNLYPDSAIVTTLEELLFSDNHFTRVGVVYTLGKTCSYGSGAALSRACERYQDSDPLLLDRLICEMNWLGVENMERYLHSLVHSSSYITRWAVVGALDPIGNDELRAMQWAAALRQDECELIRTEVEYEYQRKLKSLQTQILSTAEQRQRAKDIKKIQPLLSFWDVRWLFEQHLSQSCLTQ